MLERLEIPLVPNVRLELERAKLAIKHLEAQVATLEQVRIGQAVTINNMATQLINIRLSAMWLPGAPQMSEDDKHKVGVDQNKSKIAIALITNQEHMAVTQLCEAIYGD